MRRKSSPEGIQRHQFLSCGIGSLENTAAHPGLLPEAGTIFTGNAFHHPVV